MGGLKNRKLCWNCEGSVHVHAQKCPYCGMDLGAAEEDEEPAPEDLGEETQSFAMEEVYDEEAPDGDERVEEEEGTQSPSMLRSVALPMLLLLPGAFFLLFGLVLLLFSTDGTLSLSWNARYWYVYLLLASPLLYAGWKSLRSSESAHSD